LFTKILSTAGPSQCPERVSKVRYLVVDEIQDLVCARAAMVLAMIETVQRQGGFVLLLGDPAQSIYDYQAENNDLCHEMLGSREFLEQIRHSIPTAPAEVQLAKFYRYANNKVLEFVRALRHAMGSDGTHPDRELMYRTLYDFAERQQVTDLVGAVEREDRIAVLVRQNVYASQLHSWCQDNNIPSTIFLGAKGGIWPPEIARIFMRWEQDTMTIGTFRDRFRDKVGEGFLSLEYLENYLADMKVLDDGDINVDAMRHIMSTQQPAHDSGFESSVTISTIHKSKGLEYDTVLLLEGNSGNSEEENRVVYVAATRTREKFMLLENNRQIFSYVKRLVNGYCIEKRTQTFYLKGVDDLDDDVVAEGLNHCSDIAAMQDALWDAYQNADTGDHELFFQLGDEGSRAYKLTMRHSSGITDDICWCNYELNSALEQTRRYQSRKHGLDKSYEFNLTVEMKGLATIAYDVTDDQVTSIFGRGGMALFPLLELAAKPSIHGKI